MTETDTAGISSSPQSLPLLLLLLLLLLLSPILSVLVAASISIHCKEAVHLNCGREEDDTGPQMGGKASHTQHNLIHGSGSN